MSLETDLRTFLLADGTIAGLVVTRIYPNALPQAVVFPAVSYNTVSAVRGHHMDGPDNLAAQQLQIDVWAATFVAARALADAIRVRIDGIRQAVGSTVVQGVFFETERSSFETDTTQSGGSLVQIHRISQDFTVWFEE